MFLVRHQTTPYWKTFAMLMSRIHTWIQHLMGPTFIYTVYGIVMLLIASKSEGCSHRPMHGLWRKCMCARVRLKYDTCLFRYLSFYLFLIAHHPKYPLQQFVLQRPKKISIKEERETNCCIQSSNVDACPSTPQLRHRSSQARARRKN